MDYTEIKESGHKEWIDIIRGAVIILMLAGHTKVPDVLKTYIFGFHIPFFFILSGFLFNYDKWEKQGFAEFLKSKFKAYIVPYFIWSFVNLLINLPMDYLTYGKAELLSRTLSHLFWIFYAIGTGTPNCTPLWFLPAIFVGMIILFLIFRLKKSVRTIVFAVGVFGIIALNTFAVPRLPWHIEMSIVCALFMYVGYTIKEKKVLEREISIPGIVVIVLTASYIILKNNGIDMNYRVFNNMFLGLSGAVLMSFAIMYVGKNSGIKSRLLAFFGKNTILIMAINFFINTYLEYLWERIPVIKGYALTWWIELMADFCLCILIMYIWNLMLRKIPKLGIAVGKAQ